MSRRLPILTILCVGMFAVAAPADAYVANSDRADVTRSFSPSERRDLRSIVTETMREERQPGVDVGVWIPGRGAWVRSFGLADRKTGRRLRIGDHVRIASITKTFTATAILQLVDEDRLSLDDTLESFIPGIPNGNEITIRNLLAMTSGLYDYTGDEQYIEAFDANPLLPFDLDDVIEIVKRHEPASAPGIEVQYCNTNYWFLGAILETVTGRPIQDVIRSQILEPLKLRQTSYPTSTVLPAPFSHGYNAGDDGNGRLRDVTRLNPMVAAGAGAMISAPADLRVWARALATGTLLSPELQALRLRFGTIPTSGRLSLGYGLGIAKVGPFIGHTGTIYGFNLAMFYLPEDDATIVVVGNQASSSGGGAERIFLKLAEYLWPEQFASG